MLMRKPPILVALLVIFGCASEYQQFRIDNRTVVTFDDRAKEICVGLTLMEGDSSESRLRQFELSEIGHSGLQGAQIDLRPAKEVQTADVARVMDILRSAGVWKISLINGSCNRTIR